MSSTPSFPLELSPLSLKPLRSIVIPEAPTTMPGTPAQNRPLVSTALVVTVWSQLVICVVAAPASGPNAMIAATTAASSKTRR